MKVIILLNAKAGRDGSPAGQSIVRIHDAAAAAGIDVEMVTTAPKKLTAAAATATTRNDVDAVVAAGGDGTISAIAAALVGGTMPLGVIPLGTLNHFAKDLHIPLDAAAAVHLLASGQVRRVDVGEVNGQTFINNSSIGIYPAMVRDRDDQRVRWRRKKWLAMGVAALRTLRKLPLLGVHLEVDGQILQRKTPLVFVGNNRYQFSLPALGARHALDAGELSLHVANCTTRWGILRLAARGLLGQLRPTSDFDVLYTNSQIWVSTRRKRLTVALDGELFHLTPPLAYRIRPGALPVLAPPIRA